MVSRGSENLKLPKKHNWQAVYFNILAVTLKLNENPADTVMQHWSADTQVNIHTDNRRFCENQNFLDA